ncbi:hypothetical protein EZV62_019643 [Acer yangbiense]|uniref:Uncharacterized protein n=1 Tax=Acer yangbiense TaxID=1000413 RepID=A0A5C7HBS9_9ROSI|nr:hypothetical protein EZV62_019643 [Acer yangbiense]
MLPPKSYSSDAFLVDETFLERFDPKDTETEDKARRRNWIERGWAPWEEILTPEADFARKSLNEGNEVPLQTPEAIEAFKMLKPSYMGKKMKEMGITKDEWYWKQFEIKGDISEKLETVWLARINVNTNSQHEDGEDDKEEERVDKNYLAVGCEAAEFDVAVVAGYLEYEAGGEEYK